MSGSNPMRPSPWWALLLIPVCLGGGWFIAQLPGPASGPSSREAAVAPAAVTAPEPAPQEAPPRTEPQPRPTDLGSTPKDESSTRRSDAIVSEWTTLEAAFSESRANGKPILIDFNADWCGPCQAMKHQVFEDASWGRSVRTAVIPVSIVDRTREDGQNPPEIENLQQRFGVDAFPTLIVLSPQTGRAAKTQGYGGPERTVAWITEASASVR